MEFVTTSVYTAAALVTAGRTLLRAEPCREPGRVQLVFEEDGGGTTELAAFNYRSGRLADPPQPRDLFSALQRVRDVMYDVKRGAKG